MPDERSWILVIIYGNRRPPRWLDARRGGEGREKGGEGREKNEILEFYPRSVENLLGVPAINDTQ